MRSMSRAASTNRFAELRIIFSFLSFEAERSRSRTRSKGVSAAAKNEISCGTPSSRTTKSFGSSVGGGAFGGKPSTLTFRSTRSESMRIVSGSCAAAVPRNKKTIRRLLTQRRKGAKKNLVRIVPTFAARHGVGATNADPNRSPLLIAFVFCWTIRQTVHRSKISYHLLVSAREISQSFDFVKDAAARVSHLLHAVVAGVERLGLRVLRAPRLVLGV